MRRTLAAVAVLFMGCQQDISIDKLETDIPAATDTDPVDTVVVDTVDTVDTDVDLAAPLLVVDPRFIDFGNHTEGSRVEEFVTFRNDGDATLEITNLELLGSPAFDLPVADDLSVAPGASVDVAVGFTAATGSESGELLFNSNDLTLSNGKVDLEGSGLAGSLSLPPLDFGHVMINTVATEQWQITNSGDAPVEITSVSASDPAFQVNFGAPIVVDPGETERVQVAFRPTQAVVYNGTLNVTSNANPPSDPAPVTGIGADKPVALCFADPPQVSAISEEFAWMGNGSFDPAGRAITNYNWSLVSAPAGSAYTMGGSGANRLRQVADVAGDYVAQLVVTNDLGVQSDPCETTVTAEIDADLWIEMFWRDREDIDLHLIRANGNFNSNNDCYYANCRGATGRPWGAAGTADNPFLDLDDTTGTGPENINIADPESVRYRVVVHDYVDQFLLAALAQNRVTVKIYVAGQLALNRTVSVTEGDRRDVAEIDWSTTPPTVTPL